MSSTTRLLVLALGALVGCAEGRKAATATPPASAAVDPEAHAFYDGKTGEPASLDHFVALLGDADLVAFGELHRHPIGSRVELELLQRLADDERPVALAMEFFETDTQPVLDAYIGGTIDEGELIERTKRDEAYASSHRPLIELCRERGLPVIAANSPRRLVKGYRQSGQPYAEFLAGLSPEDRALLPERTSPPAGEYETRFLKVMGEKRAAMFGMSMGLWNDAMADSIARFRADHPEHRVLLVVGVFHVAAHLGTVTKYLERRPDDVVKVLSMAGSKDPAVPFSPEDRGEGDVVLKVIPPESEP